MNDSAKSALPSLVAKALAAELIRLPLLQTELALQSQDFLISFAYIMRRRSRRAFCGQNSSEIRRRKENYSTRSILYPESSGFLVSGAAPGETLGQEGVINLGLGANVDIGVEKIQGVRPS